MVHNKYTMLNLVSLLFLHRKQNREKKIIVKERKNFQKVICGQ